LTINIDGYYDEILVGNIKLNKFERSNDTEISTKGEISFKRIILKGQNL
jgi:hypothetical protein